MTAPLLATGDRLAIQARAWRVVIDETFETPSSVIAYGRREEEPVVLKLVKTQGDEWRSGEVLRAFAGRGMVRLHDCAPGAVLLERLFPAESLADLSFSGRDVEATKALADVITAMAPDPTMDEFPTVEDWGRGFGWYAANGQGRLPAALVALAAGVYQKLSATQRHQRLLHGDLQQFNVLFDAGRGWVAIDPKGVIGELEFEIGAALRNPGDRPDIFAATATIERRLGQLVTRLNLDRDRTLGWAFAQSVLAAGWEIEDGCPGGTVHSSLLLAEALRPMLA